MHQSAASRGPLWSRNEPPDPDDHLLRTRDKAGPARQSIPASPLPPPDRTAASLAAFLRTQLQPWPRKAEGGTPNWRLNAAVLGLPLRIDGYEERSMGEGADARAFAIVEAALPGVPGTRFGAGCHPNTVAASVLAVLNAAAGFDAAEAAAM